MALLGVGLERCFPKVPKYGCFVCNAEAHIQIKKSIVRATFLLLASLSLFLIVMSTTWNPSLQPTFVPTKADLMPSTLVLGMGVGTFTTIVMAVVLLFVFCLSGPCVVEKKLVWRIVSVLVCTLVFLILLYAPREPLYETSEPLTTVSRRIQY